MVDCLSKFDEQESVGGHFFERGSFNWALKQPPTLARGAPRSVG